MVAWRISGTIDVKDRFTRFRYDIGLCDPDSAAGSVSGSQRPKPVGGVPMRVLVRLREDERQPRGDDAGEDGRAYIDGHWLQARTETREDGGFDVTYDDVAAAQRVRIDILLVDGDLAVLHPTGPIQDLDYHWLTVFEDPSPTEERTRSLPLLRFGDSSARALSAKAMSTLNDGDNVVRALLWFATRTLMRRLRQEGQWLVFKKRVYVMYPAKTSSWAEVVGRRQVHINGEEPDGLMIVVLFHELMHIWQYDHSIGVGNWLSAFVSCRFGISRDTRDRQERNVIAFHEGFAEFAAWELWHELFGMEKVLPYRRAGLRQRESLTTFHEAQQNWLAVFSGLLCLSTPDLFRFRFGRSDETVTSAFFEHHVTRVSGRQPACPAPPGLSIWQLLRVFRGKPDTFFPKDWNVGNADNGFATFLSRVSVLTDRLDADTRNLIFDLIDPASTREPTSLCLGRLRDTDP